MSKLIIGISDEQVLRACHLSASETGSDTHGMYELLLSIKNK